jgi:hypothetical protein
MSDSRVGNAKSILRIDRQSRAISVKRRYALASGGANVEARLHRSAMRPTDQKAWERKGLVELTLNPLALLFQATGIKPKQPPKFEL